MCYQSVRPNRFYCKPRQKVSQSIVSRLLPTYSKSSIYMFASFDQIMVAIGCLKMRLENKIRKIADREMMLKPEI